MFKQEMEDVVYLGFEPKISEAHGSRMTSKTHSSISLEITRIWARSPKYRERVTTRLPYVVAKWLPNCDLPCVQKKKGGGK